MLRSVGDTQNAAFRDGGQGEMTITGAEFRAMREALGLTQEAIVQAFDIRLRTLQRIEAGGHQMPPGLASELLALEESTLREIERYVRTLADDEQPVLHVYRTDEEFQRATGSRLPAAWHRVIAYRVRARIPGLRIEYDTPPPTR